MERSAEVLFVSATQVNYMVPSGTSLGAATVTITSGAGDVSTGPLNIQSVTPNLFQDPENGDPADTPPVAQLLRLRDGVQTVEPLLSRIDMGPDSDQLFMMLYGTGIRFRNSLASVLVSIGGEQVPVDYAGPQGEFAGLDQINVRLPRSLAGRGVVPLQVTVEGESANETALNFK
jgi:uncharacterized protein (TIGR03437 family)